MSLEFHRTVCAEFTLLLSPYMNPCKAHGGGEWGGGDRPPCVCCPSPRVPPSSAENGLGSIFKKLVLTLHVLGNPAFPPGVFVTTLNFIPGRM